MARSKQRAAAVVLLAAAVVSAAATPVVLRSTGAPPEVSGLGFGFGPLVASLAEEGVYAACPDPACPRAHRMPALPLLLAALTRVLGPDTAAVAATRSALLAPWVALALWVGARRAGAAPILPRAALVGGVLLCPPWVLHALLPVPEESLLIPLLAAIVALLLWGRGAAASIGLGALIGALVLAKSGLWPLGAVLCAAAHVKLGGWRGAWPSWLALALAALGWSAWVSSTGGPLAPVTSLDGWNLHKGNNPRVLEVYPGDTLDRLSPWLTEQTPDPAFASEWEGHRFHAARGVRFWREHPGLALRGTLVKAWAFFGRVELPSPGDPPWRRALGWLAVPFLIGFRLLLLAVLGRSLRAIRERPSRPEPWLVIAGVAAYALPALVGFAYPRHALVLLAPAALLALDDLARQRAPLPPRPGPG